MSFIHLHTHSHYSLLDGLSKVDEMVDLAVEHKMPALALTDHGVLYGAIEFYKKCKDVGIKPIIGMEAYIANNLLSDKRAGIDNKRFHLTLLAQNKKGYSNLVKLVSIAHLKGYYYKPRIDKEILKKYSEGLICLSGCFGSELSVALRNKQMDRAEQIIDEHQEIFGKDKYFLEIMHHPHVEGLNEARALTIELGKKLGIPIVGTQDSHYLHPEDVRAHETLLAVQQGTDLDDTRRLSLSGDDFSFITSETAEEYFKDIPEAVTNTQVVADMCNLELSMGNWMFPDYAIPKNTTYDSELTRLTYEGLPFRNIKKTSEVVKRIEYELSVIQTKGYSPYFLVVSDLLRFARDNGILTTTRGSAAGSLVSYLLGITNVDPLFFNLPFERFLNPERPSAPDVDMDFSDTRRDEVIQYAKDKYGHDKVAQIGTFGTMMARGAVRDVARATGHPYAVGDRISKLIPMGAQGFPMTIDRALDMVPELAEIYKKEDDAKEIIDLARRMEGTVRHVSVHAAGVVISPRPLAGFIPTQYDPGGERIITQYDMHAVEDMGLLKFDFLGIKNLTILANTMTLIKKNYDIIVNIEAIPFDDPKTFELLTKGETVALFQLNGGGMTRYLKQLKPTSIHDINAMVALYRPGPMVFIPDYIKRKDDPSLITYLDPRMEEILKTSYGIITYQDDILMIAINLAGYSWGEVDKFRKAIGKKIPKEMRAQKKKFMDGCVAGGMEKEKVKELWKTIETFAAYGFNKAHAASYGRVAYQTAYMKANYPSEYMAAVLTADAGDIEKISEFITECKRMKIPVLPPDINESFGDFTVIKNNAGDEIRFGLYSVKNFGTEIADAIIKEREDNGKFKSFADVLERITHKNLNKKSLESLVKCGALDRLGERGQMLFNMTEALAYSRTNTRTSASQSSLFGLMKDQTTVPNLHFKETEPASKDDKLRWEKELLGLYVSGHPLDKYQARINQLKLSVKRIKGYQEGIETMVAGVIEEVKPIITKKGDPMAFVKIEDLTDSLEIVVFPKTYELYKKLLVGGLPLIIHGKVSHRNGEVSLLVDKIKRL